MTALLAGEAALLLGAVLVCGERPRLAQALLQGLRGVLEDDGVGGLVLGLEKVEVVDDGGELGLFGGVAVDGDFEFTPAFVGASERRLGKGCVVLVALCIRAFARWRARM